MADEDPKKAKRPAKKAAARRAPAPSEVERVPETPVDASAEPERSTSETTTLSLSPEETARLMSELVTGSLVIHYPQRDVTVQMDGAHALDLLSHFARGAIPRTFDAITDLTVATRGFTVLDTTSPLGMTWVPSTIDGVVRTTVDPGEIQL